MQSSMVPEAKFAQASWFAPYVALVVAEVCWLHLIRLASYVYAHVVAHCQP